VRFHAEGRQPPSGVAPVQILFVGRLVPYKGADIVLEAFATSPQLRDARLVIAGDGPQKGRLAALAAELKVTDRVELKGNVPHTQIPDLFRASSVFAFPSLREFGGAVAMEAMACGLPCVVLDYGGPAELVVDGTGRRIPLSNREGLVRSLRESLESMLEQSGELDAMSIKAAAHAASHYTWSAKADRIVREYAAILGCATSVAIGVSPGSPIRR
jgi:glycosyltransferase involved in cell wall biosynthesis